MTAYDPSLHRKRGLLAWLGLRASGVAGLAAPPRMPQTGDHRDAERQRMLEAIGAFLTAHRLPATSRTLAVAHDYLCESDDHLVRLIDRKIRAGKAITAEWLEEIAEAAGSGDELDRLTRLMERLESSVDQFGKTSSEARTATSDYHSALSEHVREMEHVSRAGEVISELAGITRVMLSRTREIEKQMLRSEAETRTLKRRLDEARRSADEDHLTGLPNRRAFEGRFEIEYREARAAAEPLCVAFCDIDNFKRVNDTHGHDAGDRVIKLVAESLARISGERCHVARHGGEEFVLLFRGTCLADAFGQLDRLRAQLAERQLVNRATDTPIGQVTFSGGIADVFAHGEPRSALKAADAALYLAKQQGRNRIVVADPAAAAVAVLHPMPGAEFQPQ